MDTKKYIEETPQKQFGDRHFRETLERLQRDFRDTLETLQRHLRKLERHLRNSEDTKEMPERH